MENKTGGKPGNGAVRSGVWGQLLFTALCAAGLFTLIFVQKGLWPFGNGSILMTDLYSQYTPLLYRFYDVVMGVKNLFADLNILGGANLYVDTINEVLNPFNYILLLLGRDNIYLTINVLLLLYGVGAAAAADYFLQKVWPGSRRWNVILSLSYAFGGYSAYNFQIIKWMLFPVLFPFFALALRRLVKSGRGGLYSLLLAWQLILSVQLGFMALLFVLFTGGIYCYCCVEKKERAALLGRLGLYTAAGTALSAVVLLPGIFVLFESARAGENLSYFGVMKRHGLDDLFERLFQVFQPITAALFLFLLSKGRSIGGWKRACAGGNGEGRFLFLLNGFLWFTVLLEPANLLWHLGSYVCFPVRYGYMVLFSGICLVRWMLLQLEICAESGSMSHPADSALFKAGGRRRVKTWFCLSAAVLLCVLSILSALKWEERIVQAFSSLAISRVCPVETLLVGGVLLTLSAAAFLGLAAGWERRKVTAAVCAAAGLCSFIFLILPEGNEARRLNEAAYVRMTRTADAQDRADIFSRVSDDPDLPLNAALVDGTASLSGYFPTGNKRYRDGMEALGYLTPWVAAKSVGGTVVSDFILGVKRDGALAAGGLLLHAPAQELALSDTTALKRQEKLTEVVFGSKLWNIFDPGAGETGEDGCAVIAVSGVRSLYLDAGRTMDGLKVWVNEAECTPEEPDSSYSPHRLIDLGSFADETVHVKVTDKSGGPVPFEGMQLALFDRNGWTVAVQETFGAADGARAAVSLRREQISLCGGRLSVHLPEVRREQTLFLPLAAIDGWRCEINGDTVDITPAFGGFMGISLKEGENQVVLSFLPPGFSAGLLITAAAAVLLALSVAFSVRPVRLETVTGRIYQFLLAAGLLLIYVIPAAGLCIWMLFRLAGAF